MRTPFEILDIDESATDDMIKSAYLKKVRQFSPERYPEKFKEIKKAYDSIKSLKKRLEHRLFDIPEPDIDFLFLSTIKRHKERINPEVFYKILSEIAWEELKNIGHKRS